MAEKKRHHHKSVMHHSEGRDEISESKSSVANMPQEVMYKAWPRPGDAGMDPFLDDSITGINEQQSADHAKMRKHMNVHKY